MRTKIGSGMVTLAILTLAACGCGGSDDTEAEDTTSSSTTGGGGDCAATNATDKTAEPAVDIAFGGGLGSKYSPSCLKIAAGTVVTFTGDFSIHPLKADDGTSPIQATGSGTTASFTFPAAGVFGYSCSVHGGGGMTGTIYVE